MLVKAKKSFSSTVCGNIDAGRILDVTEAKGKLLIKHGLVEAVTSPSSSQETPKSFSEPAKEAEQSGASSQADQASPQETATPSTDGGKPGNKKDKNKSSKKTAASQ